MDSVASNFAYAFFAKIFYTLYKCIYRLYFSSIAKLLGRKMAALTLWYHFYFGVVKRGTYVWQIKEMRENYGLTVVMSVQSVRKAGSSFLPQSSASFRTNALWQIQDSWTSFTPTQARNVERWSWAVGMVGSYGMPFGSVCHNLHRLRRGAISNLFSKTSVRKLQPVILGLINKLCNKVEVI